MKKLTYLILITCIMLNSCTEKPVNVEEIIAECDTMFSALYPENEPGASILIMKGDSILYEKGYGIANMETMTPIDGNTFFCIASVSKQFSAVALMMLAEEGKLSLDHSVEKWFPEFESPLMSKITLRHLLSHTSGIPDSRDRTDRNFVLTSTDTQSYAYISKLKELNFEPGTAYEYMNPTFQLMYTIIERASGMQFDQFMREKIFTPAGMEEATYFEADKFIPRMAHGYLYNKETKVYNEFDYGEESFFASKADGALYTSVREFAKWEKALRDNLLISQESKEEAHTPKIEIKETPYNFYGYGWYIEQRPDYPVKVYHTGDNGGFQIYAGRYPEQEILYLVFSNRNDRDREHTVYEMDRIFKKGGWL